MREIVWWVRKELTNKRCDEASCSVFSLWTTCLR